jgi:hypothetical protein
MSWFARERGDLVERGRGGGPATQQLRADLGEMRQHEARVEHGGGL